MSALKNFIKWYGARLIDEEQRAENATRNVPERIPGSMVAQTVHVDLAYISLLDQLVLRLGWHRPDDLGSHVGFYDSRAPFNCAGRVDDVHVFRTNDRVYVVIQPLEREPVTLEDELGLYPSDQLISSIRLMTGK